MKIGGKQQGFAAVEFILIAVVLAILGFTGYFVYHTRQVADKTLADTGNSSQANQITSYAACKAAKASKQLLTYPEQCITKDGKTFTDTAQSQKYLVIKEWGIKLELGDPALAGATYIYRAPKVGSSGAESVNLTTKNTQNMDFTCGGDGTGDPISHATGDDQDSLWRARTIAELRGVSNASDAELQAAVHIGDYYHIYQRNTGHGACSITDSGVAAQASAAATAFAKAPILAE